MKATLCYIETTPSSKTSEFEVDLPANSLQSSIRNQKTLAYAIGNARQTPFISKDLALVEEEARWNQVLTAEKQT